jgi:hypothetical protein
MGFVFSKIFSGLVGDDQMRIIIIGLDNAGKTTILCKSKLWNLSTFYRQIALEWGWAHGTQ